MSIEGSAGEKAKRLEGQIQDGDAYGALQTYKTFYARSLKKGDWQVAIDLCRSGSVASLKAQHISAGSELASLLVEALVESKVEQTDEINGLIFQVLDAFSLVNDQKESAKALGRVLKACISWSSVKQGGRYEKGDPQFHLYSAKAKTKAGDYAGASTHYLHAKEPKLHAEFLYEWSTHGYAKERENFVVRAVLQLLALENMKDANIVFERYQEICTEKKTKLSNSPLMNFTAYLLKTLERDAYPLFQLLRDKYASSLKRDPSFQMYLDRIQDRYFGVKPQKHGIQAMMDNMLGMFN